MQLTIFGQVNCWKRQQLATRSSRQDESWHDVELDLLRRRSDMRWVGTLIRQAMKAGKAGDWSELVCVDECEAAGVLQRGDARGR